MPSQKSVFKIFKGLFIISFYKRHFGVIILFLFLSIGAFSSVEEAIVGHYHLILGVLIDKKLLFYVILGWSLYYVRIYYFFNRLLKNPENEFFALIFPAFSQKIRLKLLIRTFFWVSLPITLYAFIMIGIAVKQHFFSSLIIILGFNLLAISFLSLYFAYLSFQNLKLSWKRRFYSNFINNKYFLLSLVFYYNVFERRTMVIIGKGVSMIILLSSFFLVNRYQFDGKLPVLFILFSVLAQSVFIKELSNYDLKEMLFLRNLPFLKVKRLVDIYFNWFCFFIPEIIILIFYPSNSLTIVFRCLLILIGYGLTMSIYMVSYIPAFYYDRFVIPIFSLFMVLVILDLYSNYLGMVWIVNLFPIFIFIFQFDQWEWKQNSLEV